MTTRTNTSKPARIVPFTLEIVGRAAADPEIRQVGKKQSRVCNFNLAVDIPGSYGSVTQWFRIAVWDDAAETVSQTVSKGDLVRVKASFLKASAFIGKKGDALASLEVTAESVEVLD